MWAAALYNWRRSYGGMDTDAAKELKELREGMSERLACKAVGLTRSTYRRLPVAQTPADPDAEMRA